MQTNMIIIKRFCHDLSERGLLRPALVLHLETKCNLSLRVSAISQVAAGRLPPVSLGPIRTYLIGISPAIVRAATRPRRRAHTPPGRHSAVIASHLAPTSRSPLFPARPRPPLPVWRSTAAASAGARTDPPGVSCIRQKVTLPLVMSQGLPRRLSHRPAIEALHALPLGTLPRRWAARVVLAQALLTEGARWTPTHSSRADAASRAGPVLMACRHTIRSASRPDMARSWRAVQPAGRRVRCPPILVREPRENAPGRSHRTRALYSQHARKKYARTPTTTKIRRPSASSPGSDGRCSE